MCEGGDGTDKFKLISSPDCKQECIPSCFTIIHVDSARDVYSLNLKETIYISRLKLELNVQLQHNNNNFCFL